MNRIVLLILVVGLLFSCITQAQEFSDTGFVSNLEQLYKTQEFFKLKRFFDRNKTHLSEMYNLYYRALINHAFNNHKESNETIVRLLNEYQKNLNENILVEIYQAKRMNHINLFEYEKASETGSILIENFKKIIDSAYYSELHNEQKIWKALSNTPKQEIYRRKDCLLTMHRDKVGLMNISTLLGRDSINLLFDTGANLSALKRSLAEKFGFEIIKADFYATAVTGKRVSCDLTVVKEFSIADIIVKNAVFLVLDDEYLSFPEMDYYINGVIGFPVIDALDELQIGADGNIFIPQTPTQYNYQNLALSGLMPVLEVYHGKDTLNFSFDTGAKRTLLYKPFYKKYQMEIEEKFEPQTFKSGGGGGIKEFEGYVADSLTFRVADNTAIIKGVRIHKESVYDEGEKVYGNLGQDFIKQFPKMIISFKYSSMFFE